MALEDSDYSAPPPLEDIIEERRLREERKARVLQRTVEMLEESLKNEEHTSHVKELSDVVGALEAPRGNVADKFNNGKSTDVELPASAALTSLISDNDLYAKSYPVFGTDGRQKVGLVDSAATLRRESELLRKALGDGGTVDSFRSYMRAAGVDDTALPGAQDMQSKSHQL